jgi:hypothetical protein
MALLLTFTLIFSGALLSMVPVEEYPELSFNHSLSDGTRWLYSQGLISSPASFTSSTTPQKWLATRRSQIWGQPIEAYLSPSCADLFSIDVEKGLLYSETSKVYLLPAVPASFLAINVSKTKPENDAQKWTIGTFSVPEKSLDNVALEGGHGWLHSVPDVSDTLPSNN